MIRESVVPEQSMSGPWPVRTVTAGRWICGCRMLTPLARMFGLDGPRDRLTDFSKPVSAGYYFAPSNAALRELAGPEEE